MSAPAAVDERAGERVDIGGVAMPLHFGEPAREYEAARTAVAMCHRARRALVRVSGADHRRFLQGLLTSDVASLNGGEGRQALFLDTRGHVRGTLDLWAEDDAIVIGCDRGFVVDSLPDLTRYVLAADVEVEELGATHAVLALLGPGTDPLLASMDLPVPTPAPRSHGLATVRGVRVRLARTPDLGAPGVEMHVAADSVDEVWEAFESAGERAPVYLGWSAAEALRVEAGIPRLGAEITGEEFPQEARLDDAVDYEKGCYLGQETVARIHYRGQVNRLLSGLEAEAPLPVGAELVSSEREVGKVTSVAESPRRGSIGLAYARRAESGSGAEVDVRRDGAKVAMARLVALPFDS